MKGIFFGIFLIGSGGFLLLKQYFDINISTSRFIIGFFIVCLGFSILLGGSSSRNDERLIFGSGRINVTDSSKTEHDIIFGSGTIDLSSLEETGRKIEINTVFGNTKLIIPGDRRVRIKANAAFASTELPNGNILTFGDREITIGPDDSKIEDLHIELNTVFGKTEIVQK